MKLLGSPTQPTGLTKPEWDTPANGDFARYVDRLIALPPDVSPAVWQDAARQGKATGRKGAPVAAGAPQRPSAKAQARSARAGTGTPATAPMGWVVNGLRNLRWLLLVILAFQAMALFGLGVGSLSALIFVAFVWGLLGRLRNLLLRGGATPQKTVAPAQAPQTSSSVRRKST